MSSIFHLQENRCYYSIHWIGGTSERFMVFTFGVGFFLYIRGSHNVQCYVLQFVELNRGEDSHFVRQLFEA